MIETGSHVPQVLIVEDESIIACDLKNTVESLGFKVTGVADTVARAFELVADNVPDVALLDIRLRGNEDGVVLAEQLRVIHDVPTVFLTAHSDPDYLARAYAAKPYGFLVKPVRTVELKSALNIALQLHQANGQLHERAAQLHRLSTRDELTDLYNRRAFIEMATKQLKNALRSGQPVAMLYLDIDRFKYINDRHGHVVGDQVLCLVAETMRATFREADILARLGGDEFAVLSLGADVEAAQVMRIRLDKNMATVHANNGFDHPFQISVGIAGFSHEKSETLEQLLERADTAMYRDKRIRKGETGTTNPSV